MEYPLPGLLTTAISIFPPAGQQREQVSCNHCSPFEGISFWKSSDRAGALAWSISSPLCWELTRLGSP